MNEKDQLTAAETKSHWGRKSRRLREISVFPLTKLIIDVPGILWCAWNSQATFWGNFINILIGDHIELKFIGS